MLVEGTSNSTLEVEECTADVLDQTQANDSVMRKRACGGKSRSPRSFASPSMTSSEFTCTDVSEEIAECVADINEQSISAIGLRGGCETRMTSLSSTTNLISIKDHKKEYVGNKDISLCPFSLGSSTCEHKNSPVVFPHDNVLTPNSKLPPPEGKVADIN
jgi:hypothetical protein